MNVNTINKKAAIISICTHLVLLLLFIFISYKLPATLAPDQGFGMEVNLGNSDDGSGDQQNFSTAHPAYQPEAQSHETQQNTASSSTNDILEDPTDIDAASISTVKNKNNTLSNPNKDHQKTQVQQQPKILYPSSNGTGGNAAQMNQQGASEGDGNGDGDKGVPGGTPGSKNYSGTPGNGGLGHSFSDRYIVGSPNIYDNFEKGGVVVLRITVNRAGNIIDRKIKSSSNAGLNNIALEKLKHVKFNPKESAPPEQFGDITFRFKTRKQ